MRYNVILTNGSKTVTYLNTLTLTTGHERVKVKIFGSTNREYTISNEGIKTTIDGTQSEINLSEKGSIFIPVLVGGISYSEGGSEDWWRPGETQGWYCTCPRWIKPGDIVLIKGNNANNPLKINTGIGGAIAVHSIIKDISGNYIDYKFKLADGFYFGMTSGGSDPHQISRIQVKDSALLLYVTDVTTEGTTVRIITGIPFASGRRSD